MLESGCAFLNIAVHMKNLVTILSHCDTLEKIDQILKNLEIDTLLISHIPLDPSLQKEVTYYIYDQDNPLLYWPERSLRCWDKTVGTGTLPVKLTCMLPDYGWTAIDQILKATNFALPLKYDYYSFINYDTVLTPELQGYLLDPSLSPSPVTVTHHQANGQREISTLFTILEHTPLSLASVNISKAAYLEYITAEAYWHHLLLPYSCFTLPSLVLEQQQLSQGAFISSANQNHFNDNFLVFFQNGNEPNQRRLTKAYFYHIKGVASVRVECNARTHVIKKASVIELPDNVTKLGVWDEGVYCDFLPEFHKAATQYHSITQFDSDDDLLKASPHMR